MVALLLLVGGCDYWAPPLEVKMAEDGGAYLIWWQADNARGYQIVLRGFVSIRSRPLRNRKRLRSGG